MKIIVALILAAMIFAPGTVFGWKSLASLYDVECTVDCNSSHASIDSAKPMNFIILGMASLVALGLYMKMKTIGKYETFSIKCKTCGRCTRGLKCIYCQAEKQKAI